MMRRTLPVVWIGLVTTVIGCAVVAVPVSVEDDLGFDPSSYETYSQIARGPVTGAEGPDPNDAVVREALSSEVAEAIERLGYRRGKGPKSHFLISLIVDTKTEVRRVNAADPDADYYVPKTFTTDTLILTLFDAEEGRPIWRGSASSETMIGGALIPANREEAVRRAARRLLARIPPRV